MAPPVIIKRASSNGRLMAKPNKAEYFDTTLSTFRIDRFFVGQYTPNNYSLPFKKRLDPQFDLCKVDAEIDLDSENREFLEKPLILSFDVLLNYLIDQRRDTGKSLRQIVHGAHIVCRRGILNKFVNAPYKKMIEFKFAVKCYQGIFFVKELSTESFIRGNTKHDPDSCFYFNNFKKQVLCPYGDDKYEAPPSHVVSTWEQMQGVYFCELESSHKKLKLFYGSEIDAFDKCNKVVEIKLQNGEIVTALANQTKAEKMAEKLRKWYFQTYLVGGDTIVAGCRQENVVYKVNRIDKDLLPAIVGSEHTWDDNVSFSAIWKILTSACHFYQNNVAAKGTLIVESRAFDQCIKYEIRHDGVDNILPSHFKDAFEEKVTLIDKNAVDKDTFKNGHVLQTENGWFDRRIGETLE
uniref:Decapping nuclease n=1 Tax=Panagrolaimus sp. ES5 TaxID=591445 RepID=A0AC34G0X8_9BILA